MGFFSKLSKVVAGVNKGAAIAAATLPGKAGQVAGAVSQTSGVVTAVVQQIQAKPAAEVPPEETQRQATLATAVAVDDHEDRLKQLEQIILALQGQLASQQGQPAAGSGGTQPSAGPAGTGGASGSSGSTPGGTGGTAKP